MITRQELLEAVIKLYDGGDGEEEDMALLDHLRHELPHSSMLDLIFHDPRDLTPEQVVDEAFRRHADRAHEVGKS